MRSRSAAAAGAVRPGWPPWALVPGQPYWSCPAARRAPSCGLQGCDARVRLRSQGQRAAYPQLPCRVAAMVDDEQLEQAAAAAGLGPLRRAARCIAFAEIAAAEALEVRGQPR